MPNNSCGQRCVVLLRVVSQNVQEGGTNTEVWSILVGGRK